MHPDHHLNKWHSNPCHSHICNKRNFLKNDLFLMRREKNAPYLRWKKQPR